MGSTTLILGRSEVRHPVYLSACRFNNTHIWNVWGSTVYIPNAHRLSRHQADVRRRVGRRHTGSCSLVRVLARLSTRRLKRNTTTLHVAWIREQTGLSVTRYAWFFRARREVFVKIRGEAPWASRAASDVTQRTHFSSARCSVSTQLSEMLVSVFFCRNSRYFACM